jgi:hypothetical protein
MHHFNIGAAQPGAQQLRECLIGFNCGQARKCRAETVRRKSRARTGLKDVRPKLGAGEHPWHPPFQRPFPTSRATQPVMQLIQERAFARTLATFRE